MALARGVATFVATDTASFTWTDYLTGAPLVLGSAPVVLSCAVTSTDGTVQAATLQGNPTTSGGTAKVLGSFSGTVTYLATG